MTDKIPQKDTVDIEGMLEHFTSSAFTLNNESHFYERPIYGTTLYLATCDLSLRYGDFKGHIFQDIIHKGYVIALTYGDIQKADLLYTRIHSSCVTSETLQGCDCDCLQQLEGAIERIAENREIHARSANSLRAPVSNDDFFS